MQIYMFGAPFPLINRTLDRWGLPHPGLIQVREALSHLIENTI